jgi:hypothetical protein
MHRPHVVQYNADPEWFSLDNCRQLCAVRNDPLGCSGQIGNDRRRRGIITALVALTKFPGSHQ